VNGLPGEAVARPYISTHDGHAPHLHYADENADVVTRVKAVTAAGIAIRARRVRPRPARPVCGP
jgi:hypothetical protein